MESYRFPSFSSIGSWRSEDVKKQNRVIGCILGCILIATIIVVVVFLIL